VLFVYALHRLPPFWCVPLLERAKKLLSPFYWC